MIYDKFQILKELKVKESEFKLSTPDSMELRVLKGQLWKIDPPSSVWFECTQENAEKIIVNGWSEAIIRCYPSPCIDLRYRSFFHKSRIVWLRIDLASLNLINIYCVPYIPGDWDIQQPRTCWERGQFPAEVDGWYRPDDVVMLRSTAAAISCDKIIHGYKKKQGHE